ncbi:MAG TPA: hypothetical protein EYQ18_20010 [Candidatus Handelsmanbacteria bacterium]|nr:hypothetical protein [Candidatus Handelsmanbacteria bacterium]
MSERHYADSKIADQEREDLLADLASALQAEPGIDEGTVGDLQRLAAGGDRRQTTGVEPIGRWSFGSVVACRRTGDLRGDQCLLGTP